MLVTGTAIGPEDVELAAGCALRFERADLMQDILTSCCGRDAPWPRLAELAILCFCRKNMLDESVQLFEAVFGPLSGLADADAADPDRGYNISPDRTTANAIIACASAVGDLNIARDMHVYMASAGLATSIKSFAPVFACVKQQLSALHVGCGCHDHGEHHHEHGEHDHEHEDASELSAADEERLEQQETLLEVAMALYGSMLESVSKEATGSTGYREAVHTLIECCTLAGDFQGAVTILQQLQVSLMCDVLMTGL